MNERTKRIKSVKADERTKGDNGEKDRTLEQYPPLVGTKKEASEGNRMNNQREEENT